MFSVSNVVSENSLSVCGWVSCDKIVCDYQILIVITIADVE